MWKGREVRDVRPNPRHTRTSKSTPQILTRIDEVLKNPRPREIPRLSDMPNQQHWHACEFGVLQQPHRALANLRRKEEER